MCFPLFNYYLQKQPCLLLNREVHWQARPQRGKYHCTAAAYYFLFGLSCFAFVELVQDLLVWSNPNSQTGGQFYSNTSPCQIS